MSVSQASRFGWTIAVPIREKYRPHKIGDQLVTAVRRSICGAQNSFRPLLRLANR